MTASGQTHPGAEAGTDSGHPLAELIADRLTGSLGIHHTMLLLNENTTLPSPASDGYWRHEVNDRRPRRLTT
jgi:hypothetical protein